MLTLAAPSSPILFSDHPQVVTHRAYLHLNPIGYGFQGMGMFAGIGPSTASGHRRSLLINGYQICLSSCCRGLAGAKLGENRDYLGMLLANLAAGLLAWGYARHRFQRLVPSGEILTAARGSRLLFAFELPFDGVATPRLGIVGPVIAGVLAQTAAGEPGSPICILNPIAANQLVGQHVAQPGLQQGMPTISLSQIPG